MMYKVANGIMMEKCAVPANLLRLGGNMLRKAAPAMVSTGMLGAGIGAYSAGEGNRLSGALKGGLIGGVAGLPLSIGGRHLAARKLKNARNLMRSGVAEDVAKGAKHVGWTKGRINARQSMLNYGDTNKLTRFRDLGDTNAFLEATEGHKAVRSLYGM